MMERCDHSEGIVGTVSHVFVYLRMQFLPELGVDEGQQIEIKTPTARDFTIGSHIQCENFNSGNHCGLRYTLTSFLNRVPFLTTQFLQGRI